MPERMDIENLEVGMCAPNCFGGLSTVIEISCKKEDIKGKLFVCYCVKHGSGSISMSMKEGELIRDVETCSFFTSNELLVIERDMLQKVA
jgi:hypothetical protein